MIKKGVEPTAAQATAKHRSDLAVAAIARDAALHGWPVEFHSIDEDQEWVGRLPFVPFAGLMVQIPWRNGDYGRIDEVYWDSRAGTFICQFNHPEDEE